MKVPQEAAGERLDVFLAGVGRHAHEGAEADRRRAGAGRRRARSPSATCSPAARSVEVGALPAAPGVDVAAGAVPDRLRGRAPVRDRQARGRRRASRRTGTPRGRWCRRSRGASRAGPIPSARASCTGSTATRPGCSCSRARSACTPRCRPRCASARDHPRVPRAGRGPPAGAARDDRRAAGPRPPRPDSNLDRHRRPAPRDHALRDRAGAARRHAAARDARDRPHAPDPRPPAGDRPPGRRRPGVRAREASTA